MRFVRKLTLIVLTMLVYAHTATAMAADCATMLEQALARANELCAETGRNQVCYGAGTVSATFQHGFEAATFRQPGDIVDAASIETLRTSAGDDEWGLALMRLQLNLSNEQPDHNVTFLVVGDVTIETTLAAPPPAPEPITLSVSAASQANVRSGPSRDASIVGSLAAAVSVIADGRNEDATWLHIQLPDGEVGWVFAELVSTQGDVQALSVVDADAPAAEAPAAPAPMSSFSFVSGGDSNCNNELASGLLVQTPVGFKTPEIMRAVFEVNGIQIELGSTIWAQTEPDGNLKVATLEGEAFAKQEGNVTYIPEGTEGDIPWDGSIEPLEFPDPVEGFIEGLSRLEGLVNPPSLNEVMDEGSLIDMLSSLGYDPESGRYPQVVPGYWLYWTLGRMESGACLGIKTGEEMYVRKLEDSYLLDSDRNFVAYYQRDGAPVAFNLLPDGIYLHSDSPADGVTFEYQLQVVDPFMVTGAIRGSVVGHGPACHSIEAFTWVSCESAAWRETCLELAATLQ